MKKNEKNKRLFGLVGKNISYSFSKTFFSEKFKKLQLQNTNQYINFDIPTIKEFANVLLDNKKELAGLNVTIPYKLEIIDFLDKVDKKALKIGAVNTIKINKNGKLIGYNTDVFGFKKSLQPLLKQHHKEALILGTGGASKAVSYVFEELKIKFRVVSRNPKKNEISYQNLSEKIINQHTIIINCTPLGTHPNTQYSPNIPYQYISDKHLLYDLIYNPEKTTFLKKGEEKGATIKNGLEMLQLQAEKSWQIWNT